ncbi:hypothetical protein N7495_007546 [Penicillium taxi]|uniref:uncharacterized protein n=1 Tax=Penicillium taxi TaxID=168475 RepID=UPI002545156B|nr:uncharacterized protein N7495_007546 [Penicillium taxi]KAJ5887505.1 hypothetical protein N7495_007546 [Penicillium taxi]
MPPLRAHTKSRNGCDKCRERKIKCDEQGPPCANCKSRELDCTYLKVAAARNRASADRRSGGSSSSSKARSIKGVDLVVSNSTQVTSLEINNLELMHKFSTETYQSLAISESEKYIWQITIPRLGLKHQFLMNGLLALASLHLATSAEPAEALVYYDRGLLFYDQSLAPFRNAIENISPQNCDATFSHSIVMIAINIASAGVRAKRDEGSSILENIVDLVGLLQGVKKILQVSHSWLHIQLFSQGEFWNKTTTELDADTEAALTQLATLNDEIMIGIDTSQHPIYKEIISHLRHCYVKFVHSSDPAPVMSWLASVEKEFVESLRYRQPFSLLILMYWGVLLLGLHGKRWWAHDSGRLLLSELLEALRSADPRLEHAIAWIMSQIDNGDIDRPVDENAKIALRQLQEGGFRLDFEDEGLVLEHTETGVSPDNVAARVPSSPLIYSFYHFPGSDAVIFIYVGPTEFPVKKRTLHAGVRRDLIRVAESEGLRIAIKIKIKTFNDISEASLRELISAEAHSSQ